MGFAPRPDIPIYQAALSPAMLRLAGEISDGVLLWTCPSQYVRDVVIPEVSAGRARVGKSLEGFEILAAVPSSVTEDRDAALAGIRMELHRYFGLPFYRAMFEAAGFAADVAAYDAAAPDVEAQKRAISEDFIDHLWRHRRRRRCSPRGKAIRRCRGDQPGAHRDLGNRL